MRPRDATFTGPTARDTARGASSGVLGFPCGSGFSGELPVLACRALLRMCSCHGPRGTCRRARLACTTRANSVRMRSNGRTSSRFRGLQCLTGLNPLPRLSTPQVAGDSSGLESYWTLLMNETTDEKRKMSGERRKRRR